MKEIETNITRLVGRRLKEARAVKGLTLTQLAASLGVTYQQVQKYETGVNAISLEKLVELAEILGVAAPYFFDAPGVGEDEDQLPGRQLVLLMRGARQIQRKNPASFLALCKLVDAIARADD